MQDSLQVSLHLRWCGLEHHAGSDAAGWTCCASMLGCLHGVVPAARLGMQGKLNIHSTTCHGLRSIAKVGGVLAVSQDVSGPNRQPCWKRPSPSSLASRRPGHGWLWLDTRIGQTTGGSARSWTPSFKQLRSLRFCTCWKRTAYHAVALSSWTLSASFEQVCWPGKKALASRGNLLRPSDLLQHCASGTYSSLFSVELSSGGR